MPQFNTFSESIIWLTDIVGRSVKLTPLSATRIAELTLHIKSIAIAEPIEIYRRQFLHELFLHSK